MTSPLQSGSDLLSGVQPLGPGRGRPRTLDRDKVLQVALKLVNSEGLAALTTRRLATELGVGNTTVHSAFGGKEPLLQALADSVLAELPAVDELQADRAEDALLDYLTAIYHLLVSQPAITQLIVIRRMHNRSFFLAQETIFELLREFGLDDSDVYDAYDLLTHYLFGFTVNRISRQDFDRHATIAALPEEQFPALHDIRPFFDRRTPEDQLKEGVKRILSAYSPTS